MYAYIKGELAEINTDHIVIEAGGIGYQVFISLQTFDYLPSVGENLKSAGRCHDSVWFSDKR